MNLLQLRTKFKDISGRFDLVNDDDNSDNGADFFINEGRKFLDRLDETQKSWGVYYQNIETGRFSLTFPYCRAIKEVWLATTEARWQLEKKDLADFKDDHFSGLPSSRTTGTPKYYSPGIMRNIPENATIEDLNAFMGYVDVPLGNYHEYNVVLLSVPVDQTTMVEIKGLFYSMELVNDTDKNYWSEVHPLLLIMAAMRQLEVVSRNTQGVNDWTASILAEMKQLGDDLVEEHIAEADQMEG